MQDQRRSARHEILAGAGAGARAGMAFAAAEAITASWLTRTQVAGLFYVPQSLTSFALSIAVQALLGTLLGALLGPLAAPLARRTGLPPATRRASLATCGMLALVVAHAFERGTEGDLEVKYSLLLAAGLLALHAATWVIPRLARPLAGLTSTWFAAVVVALAPWLLSQPFADATWSVKRTVFAVALVLAAALATAVRRAAISERANGWGSATAAVVLALAGALLPQSTLERPSRAPHRSGGPNVVIVSLDTVRADHTSAYGYERDTTPFLREFAREATLYANSYAASDFTLPSHASLFTGQYARAHGAHPSESTATSEPLAREVVTLAERLRDGGWKTLGVVANQVFLGPLFGLQRGFEHYDARAGRPEFPKAGSWTLRSWLHDLLYERLEPARFDLVYRRGGEINATLFDLLEDHRRQADGVPLFVFVNYMDAHVPYAAPAPFGQRFAQGLAPMRKWDYYGARRRIYRGDEPIEARYREQLLAHYDSALTYVDDCLRQLIERLKSLDLYDDTLIVVTSDHGEAFGEHGTLEHGMSVYDEQIRVPLIVKAPGQREGRVVDALVSGVDVTPSVLSLLGLAPAADAAGRDLFAAEAPAERTIFAEHYPTSWHANNNPRRAVHQTAAIQGALKVIRYDDGRLEVYALSADPGERAAGDLADGAAPELARALEDWKALERPVGRDTRSAVEALKSLGYAE